MPFVNEAQRRACYARQKRDLEAHRVPSWNCAEWERHRSRKSSRSKRSAKHRSGKTIHKGPRGGRYILVSRRKVYI